MKYTQQQVADLMGITKSTYCGYETGKRQPDVAKIKQLASILNTSGDILLETGLEEPPKIPDDMLDEICRQYNCNEEDRNMLSEYLKLDAESRKILKNYMKAVFIPSRHPVISSEITPQPDTASMSIDEKVAQYRKELEREEREAKKSEVS